MKIEAPLIIVFENDGRFRPTFFPGEKGFEEYGILIADAPCRQGKVHENDVGEWVGKERYHQTSPATELKPN